MPTLVHGVDISTLEGWMVKINSNPSMFGKSTNRRWFRVAFVAGGANPRLVLSYAKTKYVRSLVVGSSSSIVCLYAHRAMHRRVCVV